MPAVLFKPDVATPGRSAIFKGVTDVDVEGVRLAPVFAEIDLRPVAQAGPGFLNTGFGGGEAAAWSPCCGFVGVRRHFSRSARICRKAADEGPVIGVIVRSMFFPESKSFV